MIRSRNELSERTSFSSIAYMNFEAILINPLPPLDPPISDFMYIFSAYSPADWTALCFDSPACTLPDADCCSDVQK